MENDNLAQAIKTLVARFDIFDYPLTDFEIWQLLSEKASYCEVRKMLENSAPLETTQGFYFLPNRIEIVETRQRRYRDAKRKITTARRRLSLISWLPWIRLIALANSIGSHNLKAEADIDLFVIVKKNRIWLVKFIATIILALSGQRPSKRKTADTLCLSFLTDESALDLSVCRLNENDWYFTYWLAGLVPLFGTSEAYEQLLKANAWLYRDLPNWKIDCAVPQKRFTSSERSASSLSIWNLFETLSKKFHLIVLSSRLKNTKDTSIIINDHMLKLHSLDRRAYFIASAKERLASL